MKYLIRYIYNLIRSYVSEFLFNRKVAKIKKESEKLTKELEIVNEEFNDEYDNFVEFYEGYSKRKDDKLQ